MPVLESINKHATKTIDVHLMIVDPDRYIKTFADLGANILSVHYEAYASSQDVTGYKSRRNESGSN
jgi:pentose-5-phosphate-3-epimerase